MSNYSDVVDFTTKFKLAGYAGTPVSPGHLKTNAIKRRIEFLEEELTELRQAVAKNDLADQADSLIDIVYVAIGTAVLMGLPWEQLWGDVHRANMSKERLTDPRLGHKVGIGKPQNWVPPQTKQILAKAGYLGQNFLVLKLALDEENGYDFL